MEVFLYSRKRQLQDYVWKCSLHNLEAYMTPEVLSAIGVTAERETDDKQVTAKESSSTE